MFPFLATDTVQFSLIAGTSIASLNLSLLVNSVGFYQVRKGVSKPAWHWHGRDYSCLQFSTVPADLKAYDHSLRMPGGVYLAAAEVHRAHAAVHWDSGGWCWHCVSGTNQQDASVYACNVSLAAKQHKRLCMPQITEQSWERQVHAVWQQL